MSQIAMHHIKWRAGGRVRFCSRSLWQLVLLNTTGYRLESAMVVVVVVEVVLSELKRGLNWNPFIVGIAVAAVIFILNMCNALFSSAEYWVVPSAWICPCGICLFSGCGDCPCYSYVFGMLASNTNTENNRLCNICDVMSSLPFLLIIRASSLYLALGPMYHVPSYYLPSSFRRVFKFRVSTPHRTSLLSA